MRAHVLARRSATLLLFAAASFVRKGGAQSSPVPPVVAFDPVRLARIDSTILRYVDRGEVAGAVILVLRDGQLVHQRAFGMADREARRPMTTDAIFRIASQTKAITTVAALMLVEEGRLALGEPVARYIPAFARAQVAVADSAGTRLVPAARPITVHHLMTHTAGISYGGERHVADQYRAAGLGPAAGFGWYTADKDEPICATMERLATLPFVAQPGERFVYGYATDVLGCVVERAAGMPLDEFVRRRITEPLGMRDTHFFLPREKAGRLAAVYTIDSTGRARRAPDGARGQGHYVDGPRRSFSGGAGLVSTARDYARFLVMLQRGGTLDGVRYLAPSTVRLMTVNQVGTLLGGAGEGFGLGFRTLEQAGARGRPESVGTWSWGGAYGSEYMVDPREGLVVVFMAQDVPNRTDLGRRIPMLVYQALIAPARHAAP